jgi:hypothetical protein
VHATCHVYFVGCFFNYNNTLELNAVSYLVTLILHLKEIVFILFLIFGQLANGDADTIMALQPFVGPWQLFQFLDPMYSSYDSLNGGSGRRKASTYTQNNTNTE